MRPAGASGGAETRAALASRSSTRSVAAMRPAPRYNPGQVTPRPLLSILRPTCCCGGAVHVYMLLSSLLFRLHSSFPHAFVSALLLNAAHCPRCTRDSSHSLLPAGLLSLAQGLVPFLIHHEAVDPGRDGPCRLRPDICTHLLPPRPAPSLLTERTGYSTTSSTRSRSSAQEGELFCRAA